MKPRTRTHFVWTALLVLATSAAFAQGELTGTIAGTVKTATADALPGVTVTATSEALQGTRTAFSGANGDYVLAGLPPGSYGLTFVLDGMATARSTVEVDLGRRSRADAALEVEAMEDTIDVTATTPTALESEQIDANYTADLVELLPVDRQPIAIANFAPGVSDRSEVPGQISISGGIGYDNLITLDGVDTTFFIFGNASGPSLFPEEVGLFLEEAIEETQVLTGGMSAEYGRFSGGVVNAITKQGGNQFKGSFRVDVSNPSWQEETPLEDELGISRESNRNELYTATLGGRIVEDRLWFFGALSDTSRSDPTIFPVSGATQPDDFDNERQLLKLNAAPHANHSVEAITMRNRSEARFSLLGIDPRTIDTYDFEHDYLALRYTGVFGRSLLAEVRASQRDAIALGIGGSSRELRDSPFQALNFRDVYNAPLLDQNDPSMNFEDEVFAATLSAFFATESSGSHDVKVGAESFTTTQFGGNSQSSTDFTYYADYLTDTSGAPILDGEGRFQPIFAPFNAYVWNAIGDRDAELETTTTALFVNDLWRLGERWSFNLGARYEEVDGDATTGGTVADFDSIVPRLSATFRPGERGRTRITASYGEYVGRANSELFKRFSTSRNANNIGAFYIYLGAPGVGVDHAPGLDLNNYVPIEIYTLDNVFREPGLSTPRTREIALSGAMQWRRGTVTASLIDRSFEDAVESFTEVGNGTVVANTVAGPLRLDRIEFRNSDIAERDYLALQVQGDFRLRDNWTLAGHWTWEIDNDGNFVGENPGNPALDSRLGDYPEIFVAGRNNPTGRLPSHLEHKIRLWSHTTFDFGSAGALGLTVLGRYDSPLTYSLSSFGPISPIQASRDPGYATPPGGQQIFFGERGAQEYESTQALDVVARYQLPVGGRFAPWVELEVRNLFDDQALRTFDTDIRPNFAGPVDADGIPTQFVRSPTFGEARSPGDFYPGREFRVSAGIRFD